MLKILQNIHVTCGFCRISNIANVAEIQRCCKMLQNIDLFSGLYKASNVSNVAGIPKYNKCCRILICLVDFMEHQMVQMMQGFENVADVAEY